MNLEQQREAIDEAHEILFRLYNNLHRTCESEHVLELIRCARGDLGMADAYLEGLQDSDRLENSGDLMLEQERDDA